VSLLSSTQGTPERVWSAIRVVEAEGGRIGREDLWTWLNPDFRLNGAPRDNSDKAERQVISAASSLELLTLEGRDYVLNAPALDSYEAYADLVHDRLCRLPTDHADFILLETFAWLGLKAESSGTEWAAAGDFADRVEFDIGDPAAGDARRFNPTKQTSWRRWMSFLGLAVDLPLPRLGFHPNVTRRLAIELERAELPVEVPLPIETVLRAIAQRMPYLDRGSLRAHVAARMSVKDEPSRLSHLLSSALRELHDEGRIVLERRGDALGYADLAPDPFHDVKSVLTVTLNKVSND
jgi:hypothetical protein